MCHSSCRTDCSFYTWRAEQEVQCAADCSLVGVSSEVTGDSTVCVGDSIKVLVSLVPWFPFKLYSSIGFSMAGWLKGRAKTTQTSKD